MFFSVFSHPSFSACSNPIEFTCNLHHVHPFVTLLLAVRQPRFATFPRHAPEAAEIKKVPICQTQNASQLASEYPECGDDRTDRVCRLRRSPTQKGPKEQCQAPGWFQTVTKVNQTAVFRAVHPTTAEMA